LPALIPELTWVDGMFRRGLAVEYSTTSGRITRVCDARSLEAGSGPDTGTVERLPERALLPGLVNAHSHAFQRLIRGQGQSRPTDVDRSDFWTWRAGMYRAVLGLDADDLFDVSLFCFIEMLCAGITTVGEFHYLQRDTQGAPYDDPSELANRVIAAAEQAGIRICLLNVAYATGGIGQPLEPGQRRFATPDLEAFLTHTVELGDANATKPAVSIGIAPHSIRAVPREWLAPIHSLAFGLGIPLHMHVSEQPAEVSACLDAYGCRPVELLAAAGVIDEHFTAVHATHLTFREVDLLGTPGPTVCACPTTERDLGDGFLPGRELMDAGARFAIGSDSQAVIDLFEEIRLLEYNERLRRLSRVILTGDSHGDRRSVAPALLDMATRGGARSLRVEAGRIEAGALADFTAIDLEHRGVEGWSDATLDAVLALSAPAAAVSDVWVGGVQRIRNGRHRLDQESARAFRSVARRRMA
jgi:formimidoylglutamate deiminase